MIFMIAPALLSTAATTSALVATLVAPVTVAAPTGAASMPHVAGIPAEVTHPCRLHKNPPRCAARGHIRIRLQNKNNNIAIARDGKDDLRDRIRIRIRNKNNNNIGFPRGGQGDRHGPEGRDNRQPSGDGEWIDIPHH
ncbi:hypothetical protein ACGF0J_16745 [Nonomuraea sp. NPDC047897]|uniref:hypothetical protein n=1 Tax=Nonomuraea sp. NPDC047897 TaxID=3364346 RepID=UPI003718662C